MLIFVTNLSNCNTLEWFRIYIYPRKSWMAIGKGMQTNNLSNPLDYLFRPPARARSELENLFRGLVFHLSTSNSNRGGIWPAHNTSSPAIIGWSSNAKYPRPGRKSTIFTKHVNTRITPNVQTHLFERKCDVFHQLINIILEGVIFTCVFASW